MITVTVGLDQAEADTPEAALLAARTLWDEAVANMGNERGAATRAQQLAVTFEFEDGNSWTTRDRIALGS